MAVVEYAEKNLMNSLALLVESYRTSVPSCLCDRTNRFRGEV
jgi:hypothetical protein